MIKKKTITESLFSFSLSVLTFISCGSISKSENMDLNVSKFEEYINKNDVQLVDVRTQEEYVEGHLAKSVNINVLDLKFEEKALSLLDKNKTIAVYCRSGKRSAAASTKLNKAGFKTINLLGGIISWREAAKPMVK